MTITNNNRKSTMDDSVPFPLTKNQSTSSIPTRPRNLSITTSPVISVTPHRNRSTTLNSIDNLIKEDAKYNKFNGNIKLLDDIDLEKQLIEQAGGKNKVWIFILKLLILTFVVLGSGVLIFYAL
ncbi:conserved hypothetical protein [Candida tropicalis MYA-3404]|uniref:Uncharacterized protein n=1 Tax=Candida tropicalis (strain ATCC MYA-3404 / T1) TaxID=294747 RepID=C5M945_CANTT|nr:conserved hypothetical protein [Candida tropicalis MYA-3404]EER34099.1 conserved hypothetical protein [Candida tropicalis MYA-3404]KAG4407961.1 hypothetical protein JTP64_003497 [Candida tropicalis]